MSTAVLGVGGTISAATGLIGAGSQLGLFGSGSQSQPYNTTTGSQNSSSQFNPNPAAEPMYGWLAGLGQNLMQNPMQYYPGQGYVSPSQSTQTGLGMLTDGAMTDQLNGANAMYGNQSAAYVNAANQAYKQIPYYAQAAEYAGNAIPFYQDAAGMFREGADYQRQAAGEYASAVPGLRDLRDTAQGNYNFLSNAADVKNNPYVQDMLRMNSENVNQALTESWMPSLSKGAIGVNAMGNDRLGIAQGLMGDRAGNQLGQANRATLMDAYNTGIGAQTNALGMTGQMGNAILAPGAAYGQAGGAMGQGGNYLGQGGAAHQMAGNTAQYQGDQYGNISNTVAGIGNLYGASGDATMQRANILGQQAQNYLTQGQGVEAYQQQALNDQMSRWNFSQQEPWQRAAGITDFLSTLKPLGTQYNGGGTSQTGINPYYQSPLQAGIGGASTGYGLYNVWDKYNKNKSSGAWDGTGNPFDYAYG